MLKFVGKIIALTMILTAGSAFADSSILTLEFPFEESPQVISPDFVDTSFQSLIMECKASARVQENHLKQAGLEVLSSSCRYVKNYTSTTGQLKFVFEVQIIAKGDLKVACSAMTIKDDVQCGQN